MGLQLQKGTGGLRCTVRERSIKQMPRQLSSIIDKALTTTVEGLSIKTTLWPPSFENGAREEIAPSLSLSNFHRPSTPIFFFKVSQAFFFLLFFPERCFSSEHRTDTKRLGPPARRESVLVRKKALSGRRALGAFTHLLLLAIMSSSTYTFC